jgi:hypothetical protein
MVQSRDFGRADTVSPYHYNGATHVCGADIRAWWEAAAAIVALLAAVAWVVAAFHPVGVSGSTFYAPANPKDPFWRELKDHGSKILNGARWNQVAALLTGLSSLAAFLAWLLPRLYCLP